MLRIAALPLALFLLIVAAPEAEARRGQSAKQKEADADVWYELAMEAWQEGHYDEAAVAFERAHGLTGDPTLLFNAGRSYHKAKRHRLAKERYERFLLDQGAPKEEREVALKRLVELEIEIEKAGGDGAAEEAARKEAEARIGKKAAGRRSRKHEEEAEPPPPEEEPPPDSVLRKRTDAEATVGEPGTGVPPPGTSSAAATPVYKKWWFWVAIIGGVVLVAAVVNSQQPGSGGGGGGGGGVATDRGGPRGGCIEGPDPFGCWVLADCTVICGEAARGSF